MVLNRGKYFTACYIILSASGNHNARRAFTPSSRSISGAVAGEASSTSTRFLLTNLISPHLHYLPFASRFHLPHFTNLPLVFISPTSPICRFIRPLFVRRFSRKICFACTLVCLFAFMSWIWILIHSLVSSRNPLMRIQLLVN